MKKSVRSLSPRQVSINNQQIVLTFFFCFFAPVFAGAMMIDSAVGEDGDADGTNLVVAFAGDYFLVWAVISRPFRRLPVAAGVLP